MSTSIAASIGNGPYEARCQAQARNRQCSGPWAQIEVMLWPTRSWLSRTARYRCKRELCRPSYTLETACRVLGGLHRAARSWTSRRGRETHRHDYTRLPAALSDELGGLSTSLGSSLQVPNWYFGPNQSWSWSGRAWARRLQPRRPLPVATSVDARRKRETGNARAHELGLRWCLDPHARGWAVQLGTGANGSSAGRLILQEPRYVFSGVSPDGTVWRRKRPWDACALLLTGDCALRV